LALHNAEQFSCDYVGHTEIAKRHGRLRMFLLRPASDGKGPPVVGDIQRAAGRGDGTWLDAGAFAAS
jgi:hypothetical protein